MRYLLFSIFFFLHASSLKSQSADSIIIQLKSVNQAVVNKSCTRGNLPVISNRAMNVFLADKTGYVGENSDLSLFTNYVTLNSTEGKLTINHNFQKATGIDEPIKKLLSVGISTNFANGFAASFLDDKFENELGLTINYKWLGAVKTHCGNQTDHLQKKQSMNALRAAIVYSLEIEMDQKEADFKRAVDSIDSTTIPGQKPATAKALVLKNFYQHLAVEYVEKFAMLQAEILTQTNNFKRITTSWTSATAYVPMVFPAYTTAQSFTTSLREKHPYPLALMLSHTRLWESAKSGRLFFTLGGTLLFNNSKLSYGLEKISINQYKNLGGTDTLRLATVKNDRVYIGDYKTSLDASFDVRIVYFPASSHIGISFLLEQNTGGYKLLNGRLGIPVVLSNPRKMPAVNIEFQVVFFDMNQKIAVDKKLGNKTAIGVNVGIPFSRLMY